MSTMILGLFGMLVEELFGEISFLEQLDKRKNRRKKLCSRIFIKPPLIKIYLKISCDMDFT